MSPEENKVIKRFIRKYFYIHKSGNEDVIWGKDTEIFSYHELSEELHNLINNAKKKLLKEICDELEFSLKPLPNIIRKEFDGEQK